MALIFFTLHSKLNAEDFNTIKLFTGTTYTRYNQEFSDIWRESLPVLLQVETDYLCFDVNAAFLYNHFLAFDEDIDNFRMLRAILTLSYPVRFTSFAYCSFGIKTGNIFMFFDVENKAMGNESELFLGADISFQTKIWRNIIAKTSYEYGRVYTKRRISYSQTSLALGYAFSTPSIIKKFLK